MCEFTQDSWKMYRYTLEERGFIVCAYWKTESIKLCQQQFLEKFGGQHPPSKSSIWVLSKKLETKGISSKIVEEMPGSVASGTPCTKNINCIKRLLY
jgi:hypothetical protein